MHDVILGHKASDGAQCRQPQRAPVDLHGACGQGCGTRRAYSVLRPRGDARTGAAGRAGYAWGAALHAGQAALQSGFSKPQAGHAALQAGWVVPCMWPWYWLARPMTTLRKVLLPAPLGPMMAVKREWQNLRRSRRERDRHGLWHAVAQVISLCLPTSGCQGKRPQFRHSSAAQRGV